MDCRSSSSLEIPFIGSGTRYTEIAGLLRGASYTVWHAADLAALLDRYRDSPLRGAVISEERFGSICWRDILRVLRCCSDAPYLIVLAEFDAHSWVEMFNDGVFDVLTQPIDSERLQRLLRTAECRWTHQWENARLREHCTRQLA